MREVKHDGKDGSNVEAKDVNAVDNVAGIAGTTPHKGWAAESVGIKKRSEERFSFSLGFDASVGQFLQQINMLQCQTVRHLFQVCRR